ncbi:MAG TPA: LysR family transcriptional regulator [Stellaceae bacterium]|nr:LysR family transcriptional regulator [Stellaceae bacterium]
MFDLSQLRCFVAVAEELHFGRAAERLNMTQPPLSRQVQILERILDVALFERTSRSVRLTPAGRSFLIDARRILKLAESAALFTKRVASGSAGSITIGCTAASAYSFLPDLVDACRTQLPDVDLLLKEMVSSDQLDALDGGRIDVGLLRPPIPRTGTEGFRVVAEPLVAALPDGHRLAEAKSVSLADLDGEQFIMYAPYESRYFYHLLVELFRAEGIQPTYVQHLSQINTILAMVRARVGVALVPAAATNIQVKGVTLRALTPPPAKQVELLMVWRADNNNPLLPILKDIALTLSGREKVRSISFVD